MPRQPTTHAYNIPRLNVIFLVANTLLLVAVLALIITDYTREWKDVQRGFLALERERAQEELARLREQHEDEVARARAALEAAREDLAAQESDYEAAQAAVAQLEGEKYALEQALKFAKAEVAVLKYEYELAREHSGEPGLAQAERRYREKEQEIAELNAKLADFTQTYDAAQATVEQYTAEVDEAKKQIERLLSEEQRLRSKLQRLDDSDFVNKLRDAPMLDFMDPRVKIDQILLPDLVDDLNMTTTMKIDRCITCHKGIDKAGYEGAEAPYAAHPRLAEFVASKSNHPMETFGCTVCHSGRGRGTTFLRAAHWPNDPAQEHQWGDEHHWHELHHWDFDMLPQRFVEASCYQCHKGQTEIAGAPKWNEGIRLMELNGCFGCHKVKGYEDARNAGPTLRMLAAKTTRDWTYNWIRDPKGFRPHTRMPQLFDLENINDPENRALTTAGINGIVAYLFDSSEAYETPAVPVEGDVARGEALLNSVGCMGCHRMGPAATPVQQTDPRSLGPNLAGIGSKVNDRWLFQWLKNPHAYFPKTWMPNLRLTDQEAADITTYLMQSKDPEFEARPHLDSPPEAREFLMMEYLARTMTTDAARAKMAAMSTDEQDRYIGEKLIARNGCFGCHDIKGFENAQRIGTELTEEGSKDVAKFDFGLFPSAPDGTHVHHAFTVDYDRFLVTAEHKTEPGAEHTADAGSHDGDGALYVPRTRHDWIMVKLLRPRIWDQGRVKAYDERLKMPYFGFSPEEAEAMTTAVLSFQKELVPIRKQYRMSAERAAIARGRKLLQEFNCRACHVIEGRGRAIAETIHDDAFLPPILDGEGMKVQTQWLFDFLIKPKTVRPWLKARMPTFGFEGYQSNTIVEYFARLDDEPFPSVYYDPEGVTRQSLEAGKEMFALFRCQQCHVLGEIPEGVDTASLAPNLLLSRDRLKPAWVSNWILDPQQYQPGTKMPTFYPEGDEEEAPYDQWFDADARSQADALRDHLFIGLHPESQLVAQGKGGSAE